MHRHFILYRSLLLLVIALWVSGCSLLPFSSSENLPFDRSTAGIPDSRSRLVIEDLVSALIQLPSINPAVTELYLLKPDTRYGQLLSDALREAGYGIHWDRDQAGVNRLRYHIEAVAGDAGPVYEFSLQSDSAGVKRQYQLVGDSIKPISGMQVRDVLSEKPGLANGLAHNEPPDIPGSLAGQVQPIFASTADVLEKATTQQFNMYDERRSNFESVTAHYDDVHSEVLVFDNDSIRLGNYNRQRTRQLLARFDPQTDVISVVGCSHGKTALTGGNRKLALGRSSRVREELILSGVNPGKILDEGCWANQPFDEMMPRRGVVVTIKRRSESNL